MVGPPDQAVAVVATGGTGLGLRRHPRRPRHRRGWHDHLVATLAARRGHYPAYQPGPSARGGHPRRKHPRRDDEAARLGVRDRVARAVAGGGPHRRRADAGARHGRWRTGGAAADQVIGWRVHRGGEGYAGGRFARSLPRGRGNKDRGGGGGLPQRDGRSPPGAGRGGKEEGLRRRDRRRRRASGRQAQANGQGEVVDTAVPPPKALGRPRPAVGGCPHKSLVVVGYRHGGQLTQVESGPPWRAARRRTLNSRSVRSPLSRRGSVQGHGAPRTDGGPRRACAVKTCRRRRRARRSETWLRAALPLQAQPQDGGRVGRARRARRRRRRQRRWRPRGLSGWARRRAWLHLPSRRRTSEDR